MVTGSPRCFLSGLQPKTMTSFGAGKLNRKPINEFQHQRYLKIQLLLREFILRNLAVTINSDRMNVSLTPVYVGLRKLSLFSFCIYTQRLDLVHTYTFTFINANFFTHRQQSTKLFENVRLAFVNQTSYWTFTLFSALVLLLRHSVFGKTRSRFPHTNSEEGFVAIHFSK